MYMMNSKLKYPLINYHEIPIIKPCLALILGIIIGQYIPEQIRVSGILIYLVLFFFGLQLLSKKKIDHYFRNLSTLFLIICFGICLIQEKNPEVNSFPYDPESSSFTIRVDKILKHKTHKKSICRILSCLNKDSVFVESSGQIILYFEQAANDSCIIVGQEYFVQGKLSMLSQIPNPYAFDYASYLKNQNIYHQLFAKENTWRFLRNNPKSHLHELVTKLQNHFRNILDKNFPDSSNRALAKAMVLGNRDELSQDQKETFINTGAIHVLAVSGLHVGILCLFLGFILKTIDQLIPIPKIIQGIMTILCLWLFAMITGSSSAVLRAAMMFSLFYFSRDILHRHVSVYNIIFGSAFILLLLDPMQVFKVSFQFSYLAVLSIVFFFPYVNNWINSKYKLINYLWSSVALGISAQVLVFPISIFYFNKFASSFILTSIFVVQLAMVVLIATLIILIFDSIGFSIISEKILSPITNWVLNLFQDLITKVQDLPFSYIENIWLDKIQLVSLYLIIISFMLLIKRQKIKFFVVILSLCIFLFLHSHSVNRQKSIQHCAYIYNDRNASMDVFIGNKCYSLGPSTEEGNAFVYGRNRLAHKIKDYQLLNDSISENGIEFRDGIIRLGNIFIAYANVETFTEVKFTTILHYLIVSKQYQDLKKIDKEKLINTEIILDGSLAPWIRKEMISYCKQNNLSFNDIKKEGAKYISF